MTSRRSPSPLFLRTLTELRARVQSGNLRGARLLLRKTAQRKLPREHARELALLARQSGAPLVGIRILRALVRPSRRIPVPATDQEKAEYAACLSEIGANEEAETLLQTVDGSRCPSALLYRIFVLFSQWEYERSLPVLTAFLAAPGIDARQRVIGLLNLAAALVYERRAAHASEVLHELEAATAKGEFRRFYANTLELWAQNALLSGNWRKTARYLDEAESVLKDSGSLDELFIRKWKAILRLRSEPTPEGFAELQRVRTLALSWPHWETVRDCDRWKAVCSQDRRTMHYVYFGTPFASFRRRLLSDFGPVSEIPSSYRWALGKKSPGEAMIDLGSGEVAGKAGLKIGQLPHRLLAMLASDFYRPFRLSTIFSRLWPRSFFDPNSSPFRAYQAIGRLRHWLEEGRIPLIVEESQGAYRLAASGPVSLLVSREASLTDRNASLLQQWRGQVGVRLFSVGEATAFWRCAPRTARLVLSEAVSGGALFREGAGPATRYRFSQ